MRIRAAKPTTAEYLMMPLRDIVVFPGVIVPLFVGRKRSIRSVEQALAKGKCIFLCTQRDAAVDAPEMSHMYCIGTLAVILQMLRLPDGSVKVLVEGKKRCRLQDCMDDGGVLVAQVQELDAGAMTGDDRAAMTTMVKKTFAHYASLHKRIPRDLVRTVEGVASGEKLADVLAPHLNLSLAERQELLETIAVEQRLERVYAVMEAEIEVMRTEQRIKHRVKQQIDQSRKDFYLNEQMRAIQKEMGGGDERAAEISELRQRLEAKQLSAEARSRVERELKKLQMTPPMSAEITVVRNYIDWMLDLPWGNKTESVIDLDAAAAMLDEDHYGLAEPKERIIEYLAVQSLVQASRGPILCFVGPPGVGKTSLGKSIARAAGRAYVRFSLGGVRDEAEIRGHRRTYIGALPGRILQGLKKAGTDNPVFLLDEVDKMNADFRGDPAAALLEVLDPEQNSSFNDHYVDVDYDLSEVLFITTANTLEGIPPALRDRMEIIRIPGYMESEKVAIAEQFLVPKQAAACGLAAGTVDFPRDSLLHIIRRYTREAGVRSLEREIATICRKRAVEVVRNGACQPQVVDVPAADRWLGVPKFRYGTAEEQNRIGITNGLAWTEVGGDLMVIEVAAMPGKGDLIITGKLGDVMTESARAAMSYVRSRAFLLGLAREFYQKLDLHVHVPEGAIPKDGPSAGIAIATAIVSALTGMEVRRDVAMTGELTLRGRILPVGGLKEKIFAAHRGMMAAVMIPADNAKDLAQIPDEIMRDVSVQMVEHMDEVLRTALVLERPEDFLQGIDPTIAGYYVDDGRAGIAPTRPQ